jgi:hypothetical protein
MAGTNFYHCQEGVSGPWFALNCKRVYSMETALCFPQLVRQIESSDHCSRLYNIFIYYRLAIQMSRWFVLKSIM